MWDVYLNKPNKPLPLAVEEVFNSFKEFKKELIKAFKDIKEIKMAKNKLLKIY
jgi:hypothetical protein